MRGTGDLNTRLELLKRVPVNTGGVSGNSWAPLGVYPAEVLHMSARDYYAGGGGYAEEIVIAHIRALNGVVLDSGLRFRHGCALFDVNEVIPNKPRRGFVELRARRADMEGMGA